MDQESIIQALKSSCGNRNLRFQVIIQNSQLHIYINHKTDKHPEYSFLIDLAIQAIASLTLDSFQGVWLYNRKLGELEPSWQQYIKLPIAGNSAIYSTENPTVNSDEMDTLGNSQEIETQNTFEEFKEFEEDIGLSDSAGNTGLLENTGLLHKAPLQEEEINTFINHLSSTADHSSDNQNNQAKLNLPQYCFVTNKKLLTSDIIAPDQETIHLIKVFHHLSDSNKQSILPVLDEYFRLTKIPDLEKLSISVQKWFKQITELKHDPKREVEIWLSRYCFDRDATIMEFQAIADKNLANKNTALAAVKSDHKSEKLNTEYSFTPANTDNPQVEVQTTSLNDFQAKKFKFKLPSIIKKYIYPIIWSGATAILLCLGIFTTNSQVTSQAMPALCTNATGSKDYCRLAVNLAGEKTLKKSPPSIFPLTEVTETAANYGCQRYANVKAGISGNIDPRHTPVISSHGEKVLPHIYVVEAEQKNIGQPGNIKVGCVYASGLGERFPKLLAADTIPQGWPHLPYQPKVKTQPHVSFGIYTNLINLGLGAIFSAVGIAIASRLNLGIKVDRDQTIYFLAVILAVVQLVVSKLPIFVPVSIPANLMASIILPILTILAFSVVIKDFQLTRRYGYPFLIAGILTIVAVQLLLQGVFLKIVNGLG